MTIKCQNVPVAFAGRVRLGVSIFAMLALLGVPACGDDGGGGASGLVTACKANCAPDAACGGAMSVAECESSCESVAEFAQAFGASSGCMSAGASWYSCLAAIDDCDDREAVANEEAGNACASQKEAEASACSGGM